MAVQRMIEVHLAKIICETTVLVRRSQSVRLFRCGIKGYIGAGTAKSIEA